MPTQSDNPCFEFEIAPNGGMIFAKSSATLKCNPLVFAMKRLLFAALCFIPLSAIVWVGFRMKSVVEALAIASWP